MESPTPILDLPPEPLTLTTLSLYSNRTGGVVAFSRPVTPEEEAAMRVLPCSPGLADDLDILLDRAQLLEIAVRLWRHFEAGGIITSETATFKIWLRDWVDGRNHGPLGCAMLWPTGMPQTAALLREWGFGPASDGQASYVRRILAPQTEGNAPCAS